MEDPATWEELEDVIDNALRQAEEAREQGLIGLSTVRQVADALRAAGLVRR